jgi:hypothetical protein
MLHLGKLWTFKNWMLTPSKDAPQEVLTSSHCDSRSSSYHSLGKRTPRQLTPAIGQSCLTKGRIINDVIDFVHDSPILRLPSIAMWRLLWVGGVVLDTNLGVVIVNAIFWKCWESLISYVNKLAMLCLPSMHLISAWPSCWVIVVRVGGAHACWCGALPLRW